MPRTTPINPSSPHKAQQHGEQQDFFGFLLTLSAGTLSSLYPPEVCSF